MEALIGYFDVDNVWFTVLGYPMSFLEFAGTIFYLWSVWLISQRNMLTWPIGIISVILFGVLFYQIQLYSDTFEQIYYLGASIYGWWYWKKDREDVDAAEIAISVSSAKAVGIWAAVTLILSFLVAAFMQNIHNLAPAFFPVPASFPFLDALTTVMSFIAMFLMARKRIESWVYWIVVDVIGIVLYYVKDVKFISLLYVILFVLAVRGFFVWRRSL